MANHASQIAAVDFFVVPTVTFRLLYVFIVLAHDRRRVLHFNVTPYPSAKWTAQQLVEAFPFDQAPRYLIRDNDSIYGDVFQRRVKNLGLEEILTAYRSPWQNPYAERVIGSIRRECLHHVIVLGETHLKRLISAYLDYYHHARTHMALNCNAPVPREVEPPERGQVIAIPMVGGLHHRYTRRLSRRNAPARRSTGRQVGCAARINSSASSSPTFTTSDYRIPGLSLACKLRSESTNPVG